VDEPIVAASLPLCMSVLAAAVFLFLDCCLVHVQVRPLLSLKKVQVRPSLDLLCTPFVLATSVGASSLAFVGWVLSFSV
jgi:hypothetical protein